MLEELCAINTWHLGHAGTAVAQRFRLWSVQDQQLVVSRSRSMANHLVFIELSIVSYIVITSTAFKTVSNIMCSCYVSQI